MTLSAATRFWNMWQIKYDAMVESYWQGKTEVFMAPYYCFITVNCNSAFKLKH